MSNEIDQYHRVQILKDFNKNDGVFRIIFNCNIFKEGIDTKMCDSVLFMDNKESFNLIVQNIGRCLRKKEDDEPSFIFVLIQGYNKEEIDSIQHVQTKRKKDIMTLLNVRDILRKKFKKLFHILYILKKIDRRLSEDVLKQVES